MSMTPTQSLEFVQEVESVGSWFDGVRDMGSVHRDWQSFIPLEIRQSWQSYSFPMRAAIVITAKHSAEIFNHATK